MASLAPSFRTHTLAPEPRAARLPLLYRSLSCSRSAMLVPGRVASLPLRQRPICAFHRFLPTFRDLLFEHCHDPLYSEIAKNGTLHNTHWSLGQWEFHGHKSCQQSPPNSPTQPSSPLVFIFGQSLLQSIPHSPLSLLLSCLPAWSAFVFYFLFPQRHE